MRPESTGARSAAVLLSRRRASDVNAKPAVVVVMQLEDVAGVSNVGRAPLRMRSSAASS